MKPDTDFLIRAIATELGMKIYPELETNYGKANLEQVIQLLVALAAEFDTAASRRIEENQQLRLLFTDAAKIVTDNDLKIRLEKAAGETESDYKISALDKANQGLFVLLNELHAHIEALEGDEAHRIDQAIWQALTMRIMRRLTVLMTAADWESYLDKPE